MNALATVVLFSRARLLGLLAILFSIVLVLVACSDRETARARHVEALRQEYVQFRSDWLILRDALTEEQKRAWDKGRFRKDMKGPGKRPSIHRLIDADVFRRLRETEEGMSRVQAALKKLGWLDVDLESLQHSVRIEGLD